MVLRVRRLWNISHFSSFNKINDTGCWNSPLLIVKKKPIEHTSGSTVHASCSLSALWGFIDIRQEGVQRGVNELCRWLVLFCGWCGPHYGLQQWHLPFERIRRHYIQRTLSLPTPPAQGNRSPGNRMVSSVPSEKKNMKPEIN